MVLPAVRPARSLLASLLETDRAPCPRARRSAGHLPAGAAIVRVFPNFGGIFHPAYYVFVVVQGLIEHYAEELPGLTAAGKFLVPFGLFSVVGFFHYAYQKSTQPKMVLVGLAAYILIVAAAKSNEFGFPKETPAEQIVALKDPVYNQAHLIIHATFNVLLGYVSYGLVPSSALKDGKKA
jgi:hypothetical protein